MMNTSLLLTLAFCLSVASSIPAGNTTEDINVVPHVIPQPRSLLPEMVAVDRNNVKEKIDCNAGTITAREGINYQMTSPGYKWDQEGLKYDRNARCDRTFIIPAGYQTTVECNKVLLRSSRTNGGDSCTGDFITLSTETTTKYICGFEMNEKKATELISSQSSSHTVEFDFAANGDSEVGRGFNCFLSIVKDSSDDGSSAEPSEDCECGVKGTNLNHPANNRIVNGDNADQDEYSWQVGIRCRSTRTQYCYPHCGGTLITDRHILTAAHCMEDSSTGDIEIVLNDLSITKGSPEVVRYVSKITNHPSYNDRTVNYDFAILELSEPVDFSEGVRPACLPTKTNYDGNNALISGWGVLTEDGRQPSQMQDAYMSIISNGNCRENYGSAITNQMMCAVSRNSKETRDSCQGDSGGPLVAKNPNNGDRFEIVGVTSWGNGCADPKYPGVYARVTSVMSWIKSNTRTAEKCNPN